MPIAVHLDPSKRYYFTVLPGDAANPFEGGAIGHGMGGVPIPAAVRCATTTTGTTTTTTCTALQYTGTTAPPPCTATPPATSCLPGGTTVVPGVTTPLTVFAQPTPFPPAQLSVFVFQDDFPLNGEHDGGGGVDVLGPN